MSLRRRTAKSINRGGAQTFEEWKTKLEEQKTQLSTTVDELPVTNAFSLTKKNKRIKAQTGLKITEIEDIMNTADSPLILTLRRKQQIGTVDPYPNDFICKIKAIIFPSSTSQEGYSMDTTTLGIEDMLKKLRKLIPSIVVWEETDCKRNLLNELISKLTVILENKRTAITDKKVYDVSEEITIAYKEIKNTTSGFAYLFNAEKMNEIIDKVNGLIKEQQKPASKAIDKSSSSLHELIKAADLELSVSPSSS